MMKKLVSVFIAAIFCISLIAPLAIVRAISTNLILNPSIETASQPTLPDSWTPSSWGTNSTAFSYVDTAYAGSKSLLVTMASRTDGDAKWMHAPVTVTPSTSYTYAGYYKSTVDTELDFQYTHTDGSVSYAYAQYVPASSTWKETSVTFTTPATVSKVVVMHVLAQAGSLQTDEFSLDTTAIAPPTDQSNLISNPSFETANGSAPAGWVKSGWGTHDAQYIYESTGRTGTRSATVTITNYTSGDAKWSASPITVTPGKTYEYSDYYKATAPSRIVVGFIDAAGAYSYSELANAPASSTWVQYETPIFVPANATKLTVYHLLSSLGSLTIDDAKLAPTVETPVAAYVPNGSLESTAGSGPAYWQSSAWGTNTASFAYLNSGRTGTKSVKVTVSNYASGDAKWYFSPTTALVPGKQYRFTTWYKTNAKTPKVIAMFTAQDGTVKYNGLPNALPGTTSTTAWQQYTDTFFVPVGTTSVSVFMLIAENGWLQTDDYSISDYAPTGFNRPLLTLTFDDGHEDNVSTALPLMKQYGYKSTQCFATSFVSGNQTAINSVKAFYAAGHEICSHSVTHPFMTSLSSTSLRNELMKSQQLLQSITGAPVKNFAFPYGDYNATVLTQVKRYYTSSRTVDPGFNSKDNFDAYRLRVQNVLVTTTPEEIQGWIAQAQADNTWLILVLHRVADNPGQYDSYTTTFAQYLDVIKASGITVSTYQAALAEVKGQF